MKGPIVALIFVLVIVLSSFVSTLNFNNYLFINVVTYVHLAFCIVFLLVSINFLVLNRKRKNISIEVNLIDLLLLSLVVYVFIRYGFSPRFRLMPNTILFYGILLISYFFIKNALDRDNELIVKSILCFIVVTGITQSIYGLLQFMNFLPNLFSYKIGGSFGNPGDLANFLALSSAIAFGLVYCAKTYLWRLVFFIIYALHVFIIVVSMARTAWIATFLSSIFILYHFRLKHSFNQFYRRVRKLFILFSTALLLSSPFLIYKLYTIKPSSAYGRLFIWELCLESLKEKPILGHGYESFVTVHRQKQMDYFINNPKDMRKGWIAGEPVFAFNDYIQLTLEYGIIALLILLLLLYKVFFFNKNKLSHPENEILRLGQAGLLSIVVCMLFSYPLQNPTILICFIFQIALVSSLNDRTIFTIKFSKWSAFFALTSLNIVVIVLAMFSIKSITYGLHWKNAYEHSKTEENNYLEEYKGIYPFMRHNRSFLLNYGSILLKKKEYRECITHFEYFGYLIMKTDMFLMLGEAYEKQNDYKNAELSYQKASYLVPHKFMPKYKLFKLYQLTGRYEEAWLLANKIRNMNIKVYSEPVRAIKTEVNEHILSQKNTNIK